MVTLERGRRRMGQSQATSIFWGLVSVFFAGAACYYFWKYHENESTANVLRDQVMTLQDQRETLNSQKQEMQSNISETEAQLKTREDFLQDKEAKLGLEESRLEALGAQSDNQSAQSRSQTAVVKKFNDAVRKLVKGDDTDVVVRGGRPVLRVPSSVFFDFGSTTLKPEGKTLLKQIAQAMDGQLDNFELRIETFTDTGGEADPSDTAGSTQQVDLGNGIQATPTPRPEPGWGLTGTRAGVLARYLREQTPLPFQNVLVVPRADTQPIIATGAEGHARNRRVEITITPLPAAFHPDAEITDLGAPAKPAATPKAHKADQVDKAKKTDSPASGKAETHTKSSDKNDAKTADKPSAKSQSTDDSDADLDTPKPKTNSSKSSKN